MIGVYLFAARQRPAARGALPSLGPPSTVDINDSKDVDVP